MVQQAVTRHLSSCVRECRLHRVCAFYVYLCCFIIYTDCHVVTFTRKIWDTYSGEVLHSFPHNHIVRSVAISPSTSHLLTGGQEKKVRMFDLRRPDAEPEFFFENGATVSHDGTVKSVVWVGEHTGVTAGEDGLVKFVRAFIYHIRNDTDRTVVVLL